jgi:hypothetical protein
VTVRRPRYIEFAEPARARLRYVWGDLNIFDDLPESTSGWIELTRRLSARARVTLGTGMFEWLYWRFDGLHDSPDPKLLLQAFWCAAWEPRCLRFFDLGRSDWPGPVLGPLWCGATWLELAVRRGGDFPEHLDDAMDVLVRLCRHVVPERATFDAWSAAALDRLTRLSPAAPDDPFADLFDPLPAARDGTRVGPIALDPQVAYEVKVDLQELQRRARQAVEEENPYVEPQDGA